MNIPPTPTGFDSRESAGWVLPPPIPEDYDIDLFVVYADAAAELATDYCASTAAASWAARFQAAVRLLVAERRAAESAAIETLICPEVAATPPRILASWFPE